MYLITGFKDTLTHRCRECNVEPGQFYTGCRMKLGKKDRKHQVLITGAELHEFKLLPMPESFGLERRGQRYEGKLPIGLYRWDLECLLDTLSLEWEDRFPHPRLRKKVVAALRSLHDRLRREYDSSYGQTVPETREIGLAGEAPRRDCLASRTNGYT